MPVAPPWMRRSVPSTPVMGRDAISSGISGEAQATCSMRARPWALRRDSRLRPEPLSTTGASLGLIRVCHHWRSSSRDASVLPRPLFCRLSVRKTCCAITLLLNLLMSRTTSASGGELALNAGLRVAGTCPSRTRPVNWPPDARHIPSMARAAYAAGSA